MKQYLFLAASLGFAAALQGQIVVQSTDITSDTVWGDDETDVVLDGPIFVKNDASLTILAGTIVRGQPRTASTSPGSLIVTQEGYVNAQGDATNPIIFTTAAIGDSSTGAPDIAGGFLVPYSAGSHTAADFYDVDPLNSPLPPMANTNLPGGTATTAHDEMWGGLVILGSAPTNVGDAGSQETSNPLNWVHHIEGLTKTTDTDYGGIFVNDNSGIYRYISIRHGGDEIGDGNEINGVTLGGVGSGTIIEYIEVYCNFDDGFEWFGGTVNCNHLVVTYAGDDQFDGDQGYTGKVQFAFATLPYFAIGSKDGDKGFEFDGEDGSNVFAPDPLGSTPFPQVLTETPTPIVFQDYWFYNTTIVGPSAATGKVNSDCGTLDLKANYAGTIAGSIFVNFGTAAGLSSSTANAYNLLGNTWHDVGGTTPGGTLTQYNPAAFIFDGLAGEDSAFDSDNDYDPRPIAGKPGAALSLTEVGGIEKVSYRGAFAPAPAELWTAGWTVLSLADVTVQ